MKYLDSYNKKYKEYVIVTCKIWSTKYFLLKLVKQEDAIIFYDRYCYYDNNYFFNEEKTDKLPGYDLKGHINNATKIKVLYDTDDFQDAKTYLTNLIEVERAAKKI